MGGDLGRRIWFTLGALLVYRLGTHLPIPGIEPGGHLFPCRIPGLIVEFCSPGSWGLPRLFDALTGGGFGRISIFALGLLPYLAASGLMLMAAAASSKHAPGEPSHLPLKLNAAGVIPPIFASSLLLMPLTLAGFSRGGPDWLIRVAA